MSAPEEPAAKPPEGPVAGARPPAPLESDATPPEAASGFAPNAAREEFPRLGFRRLAVRIGTLLCIGSAIILAGAAFWNVSLQREHMTTLLSENAAHSADLVRHATREHMLENRPEGLRRVLEQLGEDANVERIRIFDKKGRVLYSTSDEEVGHLVDVAAEQCVGCHQRGWTFDELAPHRRVREFTDANGVGILAVTTPIPNEPSCSSAACHVHDPEKKVLGVLDVQLFLAPVEAEVAASERQMAVGLGLTTIALLLFSGALIWKFVIRPVRRLTAVTRAVRAGDLSVRAVVTRNDEIGELTRTWNATVEKLAAARGRSERLVATLEDRVEAKTDELRAAHEQMLQVEKMASLGKLAAVVAHEINNPLAGIATYARLLRKRMERRDPSEENGETARALELMESEAARCGEIVRNLLLFSRTPGAQFVETNLRTLLERCVLLFHHQADLQEVDVDVVIADDLPLATWDPSQIQQLILALSMNAIEAMPEGGVLSLRATRGPEDTIELTVADTGQGIAAEDLPHVFEPFYTTKPEGKGVGLGLAVVYGIARRHGGEASVSSDPGIGTKFTVRLPLEPQQPDEGARRLIEEVIS